LIEDVETSLSNILEGYSGLQRIESVRLMLHINNDEECVYFFKQIVGDTSTRRLSHFVEVNFEIFTESRRVVVPQSFGVTYID